MLVRPKAGILDPQGQAVEASLRHLGFEVAETRVGRLVELDVSADDADAARAQVERMCEQLLANPLIESYEIEVHARVSERRGARAIAVVVFPGSNDDRDAARALDLLGAEAVPVWHGERRLPPATAVVLLPGGFSFGDYLRAGAFARFSPVMGAVGRFAGDGGLVLGICNGFQILTEARLLPGALRPNASPALRLPRRDAARRGRDHRLHGPLPPWSRAAHPGEARRGLLVRGSGHGLGARRRRSAAASLRRG